MWQVLIGLGVKAISRQELGIDPNVLKGIQEVHSKAGLTPHVKAAYNAYDGSYEGDNLDCNNSSGSSYIGYASKGASLINQHNVKMAGIRLGNIQDHLQITMQNYTPSVFGPLGALPGKVFSNPIYLATGAVILVLFFVVIFGRRRGR